MGNKTKPLKIIKKDSAIVVQGKSNTLSNHKCNIKCFRCLRNEHIDLQYLNKKVMKEHKKTKFKSEKSKEDEMLPLEDYSDAEYPADEKGLMIRVT